MRRALVSGAAGALTHLHLRPCELAVLLHLLEYAENAYPSALTRLLAGDLSPHTGGPPEAAEAQAGPPGSGAPQADTRITSLVQAVLTLHLTSSE
ncbi:hypothetical protein [Streptomyces nigrescens]|uniref:hypothetical protein n=1 Tax=Streptomyces nigrescens TaxID=1920 RepID=UPI0036FFBB55